MHGQTERRTLLSLGTEAWCTLDPIPESSAPTAPVQSPLADMSPEQLLETVVGMAGEIFDSDEFNALPLLGSTGKVCVKSV